MTALNRMKTLWLVLGVSLAFAGTVLFPVMSKASQPGYIALGDSIDAGVGAINSSTGLPDPSLGYVSLFDVYYLAPALSTPVDLYNLSQPGATTKDIAQSQLPPAIVDIQNYLPFGVVVSWGGGGNDLLNFIQSPQAATCRQTLSCLNRLNALLNNIEQTVDLTIKALRASAGSNVPILVRTQYNAMRAPLPSCNKNLADLADVAVEGGLPGTLAGSIVTQGLNDRIRAIAGRYGAKVIDIFQAFYMNIILNIQNPGSVPLFIAADCIHPSNAGHAAIAQAAFAAYQAAITVTATGN